MTEFDLGDIRGPQGPKGDTGPQGSAGPQGPQGPAGDVSGCVKKSGDAMEGNLLLNGGGALWFSPEDSDWAGIQQIGGDMVMSCSNKLSLRPNISISAENNTIENLGDPSGDADAANRRYVDYRADGKQDTNDYAHLATPPTAGTNTVYTLSLDPPLAAYTKGMLLLVNFHAPNPGGSVPPTLNIDGLGETLILPSGSDSPLPFSSGVHGLIFDGTYWRMWDNAFVPRSMLQDFVIDQGLSDGWTYRKWNGGLFEAWGSRSYTKAAGSLEQYGNVWKQNWDAFFPAPCQQCLSTKPYSVQLSGRASYTVYWFEYGWPISSDGYIKGVNLTAFLGGNDTPQRSFTADIQIHGYWK